MRLEGISKYVVNWTMRAGDLVMDKDMEGQGGHAQPQDSLHHRRGEALSYN